VVSSTLRRMATRRTVSVEIDAATAAIAELAAAHHGIPVAEWIARGVRREFARISPGPGYVQLTETEMAAEDALRAADEAAIAAEAKRFRAAG
jgi:hypothetical protein